MFNRLLKPIVKYIPENNRVERIWKLAQVDFKSRYYNDKLGLLWALIKPLFEVSVYFIVFKLLFNIQQENYAVFLFSGIILWQLFAEISSRGMRLLHHKLYLIENIQLERIDLYISFTFSVLFGFLFNLLALFIISVINGTFTLTNIIYLPIIILTMSFISIGFALALSCIQPFIKDIHHGYDLVLMLGFWGSGIFFDSTLITEKIQFIEYINPFIGIIANFHAVILESYKINIPLLSYNLLYSILILILGLQIAKRLGGKAVEKL